MIDHCSSTVGPMLLRAALVTIFLAAPEIRAAEDRYDLLGKVLAQFVRVFAGESAGDPRALQLVVSIEQMTGLPPQLVGTRAEIAIEPPDKLRLRGPILGETFTLVRNGNLLWVHPAAKARLLLDPSSGFGLPPPDKKFQLRAFKLPIPEKQLVFLPVLFAVTDVGRERFRGEECRVLDVRLMPELAAALEVEGWVARVWVKPDATPARLTLARRGWNIVVRFEEVVFSGSLPAGTWKPAEADSADYLELQASDYSRFLRAITAAHQAKTNPPR